MLQNFLILIIVVQANIGRCPSFWSKEGVQYFNTAFRTDANERLHPCMPKITDITCHRSLWNWEQTASMCSSVVWLHPNYRGDLHVTDSAIPGRHCIITYKLANNANGNENRSGYKNKCFNTHWETWEPWQACSSRKGRGVQYRRRKCNRSEYKRKLTRRERSLLPNYALKCAGKKIYFRRCQSSRLKKDYGQWASWSQWSSCSRSCGIGLMIKRRDCRGYASCHGPREVSLDCKMAECPTTTTQVPQYHNTRARQPDISCGTVEQGCGYGQCVNLLRGRKMCKCNEGGLEENDGSCAPNPVMAAELPTSFEDCDEWEFSINNIPLTVAECKNTVKLHLNSMKPSRMKTTKAVTKKRK